MKSNYLHCNTKHVVIIESLAKKEWLESAVHEDIFNLNVRILTEDDGYDYLLYSHLVPRRNDGRIRDNIFKRYRHIEAGGWYCAGIDPLNNYEEMLWGCFKPQKPRRDHEKVNKVVKYEHPYKVATRAFFLSVPLHIWELVSDRFQIPITEDDKLLGFWHWVWLHNLPLIICEGCKKAGALLTLGFPAVGLPGVNAAYRNLKDQHGEPTGNLQLIADLEHFAQAGRNITLCFDKDTNPVTAERVRKATAQTARLLSLRGCKIAIANWEQSAKGIDDLIIQAGSDTAVKALQNASELERWQASQYNRLTYNPALQLSQRYLGEILIPEIEKLIVFKSPKGTGKTETLSPIVAEAIQRGQPVILISHRVQLAQAIAARIGIPYISEVRSCEYGALLGFALCVDSLHPFGQAQFNAENWRNPLVIIDESEQVFWHTLTASTDVKQYRLEVFKQMSQLFKNALAPGAGKIILADADMTDLSIELVLGLGIAKDIYPYIVSNIWKGSPYRVYNYEDTTPIVWLEELEKHIRNGGKPFISVDGARASSKWGTKVLEGYLKKLFPNLKIFVIDSDTILDPEHESFACIENLNTILLEYDIVIASPTIGTGVSIDIAGHFTSVWGCFRGVASENSTRQAIARLRESVDRHLWISKRGLGFIGNGALNIKSLLSCEYQKFKANLNILQQAGLILEDEVEINKTALNVWAKMGVRLNAGMTNYRETVISNLREEGHIIMDSLTELASPFIKEEIQKARDNCYLSEMTEIVEQDISKMTETEYQALKKKKTKTKTERHQQRKYNLKEKYGIDPTTNLIEEDDQGYYSKLKLHYYLGIAKQFLENRELKAGEKLLESKAAWLPDFNKGQIGLKIAALERFKIPELIAAQELRGTDTLLQELAENALSVRWQVKAILGVTLNEKDSPIVILRHFLAKLGLRLEYLSRDGSGERARVYRVVGADDGRNEIFKYWLDSERPLKVSNRLDIREDNITNQVHSKTA